MASITRRLLLQSRQCSSRIQPQVSTTSATQWQRPFSTTPFRCDKKNEEKTSKPAIAPQVAEESAPSYRKPKHPKEMTPQEEEAAMMASLRAQTEALFDDKEMPPSGGQGLRFAQSEDLVDDEDFSTLPTQPVGKIRGFWSEGDPEMGPDEDYYGDDITSHGHGLLQEHRELREYARLIAWELPLLSQLARPFEPPTEKTPFRFRYTSYLGESHPAANKVVVEFCPRDLNLTQVQVDKMIKLAGPRYNPSTTIIKMSCESFDSQSQNKRYLGETIHSLIAAAKDSSDTFADVPFDFRHHKPKVHHQFPKEWILTKERKQYLDAKRAQNAVLEDQKRNNGELIDGKTIVDSSLSYAAPEPVMVEAPKGRR